ncbi:MAG: zf-HC2 domain-containing protein [Thermoanaerobaculia bacterium]
MTCDQAIERLPWLLNGSLQGEELQEVQHHLETCEGCRLALVETRDAWRIFGQHLPSEALVALAYGNPPSGLDPAVAERHLASCPECAAEMELARMSRRLEEDDRIAVFPPAKAAPPARETAREPRFWRGFAVAASVAGLVAFGGWFKADQRTRLLPGIQQKQAALAAAMEEQRQQMARISQPQVNSWNQVVNPTEIVRGQEQEIVVPAGQTVTPALAADPAVPSASREIDILDETGKVRWYSRSLRLNPDTQDFTITFPAGFFAPGKYRFQLYTVENGERVAREGYNIRVE